MPNDPAQKPPTNRNDVIIAFFTPIIDKGNIWAILILCWILIALWIVTNALGEEGTKEVVMSGTELVAQYPAKRPIVTTAFLLFLVSLIGNFRQYQVYKKHIDRIIDYRRMYFHHMRACFDYVKEKLAKNEHASWNEFKSLQPEDIVDLDAHYHSNYRRGGRRP